LLVQTECEYACIAEMEMAGERLVSALPAIALHTYFHFQPPRWHGKQTLAHANRHLHVEDAPVPSRPLTLPCFVNGTNGT